MRPIDNINFKTLLVQAFYRPLLQCLLFLTCTLSMLVFCFTAKAQTMNSAESGELFFESENSQMQAALHLKTDISMEIEGMTNRVVVQQSFRNATQQWQEGVYVFPLPEDSAVNKVRLILSDREIIGEIHERVEAEQVYQQALAEGKKAALVEQQRPNMFTQRVANIAPGEIITVELQYIQAIRYDSGSFSLRFPMTITPRYMPGVPISEMTAEKTFQSAENGWARPTNLVPDADKISPPYLISNQHNLASLNVTLNAGLKLSAISSPSHDIDIVESGEEDNQIHLSFKEGSVLMDRDFELRWVPQSESAPLAATFADQIGDTTYLQLMLIPPQIKQSASGLSREFIIVLDTSGSMGGNSIIQARQSVELALSRLNENDLFNVIEFNNSFRPVFTSSLPANTSNIQQALRFVRSLDAGGGTNMMPALEYAFLNGREEEAATSPILLKQVVFITDGSVGNEAQLFQLIQSRLGNARLFTIGIGSAPNSYFMRKSAELGRGSYTFISDLNQIAPKMDVLFRKLENAVMAGVQISWPAGTKVEYYPAEVPDLYLGEPLFVTAKIEGGLDSQQAIIVSGEIEGRSWQRKVDFVTNEEPEEMLLTESGVATYWARQKIESLLDALRMGDEETDVKKKVLAVALPFQLLSPYSSFVAVEKAISRPETSGLFSSEVANEAPAGQDLAAKIAGQNGQMQQIVYPRTATPAAQHFVYGSLALMLALIIYLLGNDGRLFRCKIK